MMENFDPFKVKDKHGDREHKSLNMKIFAAIGCVVIALLFFFISAMSSESGQVSTVNEQITTWNKEGDAGRLRELAMHTKVMPSIGTGVTWDMHWTDVEQPNYESQLEAGLGNELKDYNISYHVFTGNTTLIFPTLIFDESEIPTGDGSIKCIHVKWTLAENSNILETYSSVKNFPECEGVTHDWRKNDPRVGINVQSWFQHRLDVGKGGCRAKGGVWSNKAAGCYAYDILDDICLKINDDINDYGEDVWYYEEGCYHDGSPARYKRAVPGETYRFDDIRIEIRDADDPFLAAVAVTDDEADFGTSFRFFKSLGWILLLVAAIIAIVVFLQVKRLKSGDTQQSTG